MAISLDPAARKLRIEELEAERRRIEAEMSPPAQPLGSLFELRERLVVINEELKRLRSV